MRSSFGILSEFTCRETEIFPRPTRSTLTEAAVFLQFRRNDANALRKYRTPNLLAARKGGVSQAGRIGRYLQTQEAT